MLVALLLTTLLAGPAAEAQVPTQAQAEELARQGQHAEALDAFRRRAAANPNDLDARLWIARLHEEMGRPDLAEPVYRSVLLESPDNVDAAIGIGRTLVNLHRGEDAITALGRAGQLAPKDPAVGASLGAAHLQAGNIKLGLSYLDVAASVAPTPENQLALEEARRLHGHRVEATAFFEDYSGGVSGAGSGNLLVDYRLHDRFRVNGRGQYQKKFDVSDQRGGGGFEWRPPYMTVVVSALFGPGNDVLPEADALFQVGQTVSYGTWDFQYRYVSFPDAHVSVVSPGVRWEGDNAWLGVRYALAITDYAAFLDNEDGHTASVESGYQVTPRVWVNVGYIYGIDDFDSLSPDRLGAFKAHTIRGGVRIDLASMTSILGGYDYQWRDDDSSMSRVTVKLIQSF
jgi:tetratricopeptide (TPR) repeat protein